MHPTAEKLASNISSFFSVPIINRYKQNTMSASVSSSETSSPDFDAIHQDLYESTLGGKWEKVIEIYTSHSWAHTTHISATSKDTALHVAVDNGKAEVVQKLVQAILNNAEGQPKQEPEVEEIKQSNGTLGMQNEGGDTPLHLAASKGFEEICYLIAKENGDLLTILNKKGESPIFLAAFNCHRRTFLCLHEMHARHHKTVGLREVRRYDGDTILHGTIRREHFVLAVIIVELYKYVPVTGSINEKECIPLIGCVNQKGYSPLKLLATRPAAFKSRSNLPWLKSLLYRLLYVDVESVVGNRAQRWTEDNKARKESGTDLLPRNYLTCFNSMRTLQGLVNACGWLPLEDAENPELSGSQQTALPANYDTIYNFIQFIFGTIGYGLTDLRKTKQKHALSVRLLDKLMENASVAYVEEGGKPNLSSSSDGGHPLSEELGDVKKKGLMDSMDKKTWNALLNMEFYGAFMQGGEQPTGSSSSDDVELKKKPLLKVMLNAVRREAENGNIIKETTLLIAAKYGILEMVTKILVTIPTAIHELTSDNKNILAVAVENRQPHIISALQKNDLWRNLVLAVDKDENTVMHLAAKSSKSMGWQITGSFMAGGYQMVPGMYVESLAPKHILFRDNNHGKTPKEIFSEEHEQLVEKSGSWLKETSESCSVIATLNAGVAFATSITIPGGNNDNTGKPNLEGQPAFELFAITSLVALCFSITSLIMFLSILTSRKDVRDFRMSLPLKLLLGLSSLFISIASMFVSFCAAHFFVLWGKSKGILFPIYVVTCLPISLYAMAQFPLYADLFIAIMKKVPQPSHKGDDL